MSNAKHTPGPWRAKPGINQMIDDGTTITSVNFDEDSPCDCWWIFSDAEEHGSAEKDAHLIAAAPDMLATLQELSFQFDGLLDAYQEDMDDDVYEALSKLALKTNITIINAKGRA